MCRLSDDPDALRHIAISAAVRSQARPFDSNLFDLEDLGQQLEHFALA